MLLGSLLQRLRLKAEGNGIVDSVILCCVFPIPSISPISVDLLLRIASLNVHTPALYFNREIWEKLE